MRTTEKCLESRIQQFQTIDPKTDEQWQRLQNTLERKSALIPNGFTVPRQYFFKPAFSFALICALLIVVSVVWLSTSLPKLYQTANRQQSTITLQDSTKVTLNYLSELKVNRSPFLKTRSVVLKGEALFQVHRDGTPFVVTTDIGTIRVLGTEFNVRVRNDKMEVAVLNGSVKVSVNKNGSDNSIVLTKGQILICDKNHFLGIPEPLPFSDYPGWTHGRYMYYRTTLLSVCQEMELHFDVKIRIKRQKLSNITITGIIDSQSIEAALTTLTQLTGNSFRYENGGYVIY